MPQTQIEKLKDLKSKVLEILEKYENTRNDDAILTFMIIYTYLRDEMFVKKVIDVDGIAKDKYYISTTALKMVREDHVKRIRAKIQNDELKFLPTKEEVRKARRISETTWHYYLTKNPT